MDDTQIIQLYFSRSESAIAETDKKYGAYLNQVSYNILRCREDTEEIVEDTYFAAWNQIPPTVPSVLKHFLSRITRNLSFSRLDYITAKRRDAHMSILLSELDACIPDRNGDPAQLLDAKHMGQVLNRFLSRQGKTDCGLFLSRYYYSMTIPEVARQFSLTERTVKYRLSKLRQGLRKELEKEGIAV